MLGCGNSKLSEEMYDDGYHNIVNVDVSVCHIAIYAYSFWTVFRRCHTSDEGEAWATETWDGMAGDGRAPASLQTVLLRCSYRQG